MAYSNNPNLPRVRMKAVRLVRSGWSTVKVARHFGYAQGTIIKWCQRAPNDRMARVIPTESSRPHSHLKQISPELEQRIIDLRLSTKGRCAEFLHYKLEKQAADVSLSTVKRVLKRNNLTRYSKWKKWHQYPSRPLPEKPGILVQIDTIHLQRNKKRLYIYTLLDVCSRWAYALPVPRINTHKSLSFVERAKQDIPFLIRMLQSDHGPEFSKWFTKRILERGINHRHSRVRRLTDNGHLERFNRTIQEECLLYASWSLKSFQKAIPEYINYYNTERPHMGIDMQTPEERLKLFQGID